MGYEMAIRSGITFRFELQHWRVVKQDENIRWRWICEKVYLDDDKKSISEDDIRKGMYK